VFRKCYCSVKRKLGQGSRPKTGRRSGYRSGYGSGYGLKEGGGLGTAIERICRSIIEVTDYKAEGRGIKTIDFRFLLRLCFSLYR